MTERVCIPVDHVGLFIVTNALQSRALVPRSAGRRIGPAEVWRQVHEPEPAAAGGVRGGGPVSRRAAASTSSAHMATSADPTSRFIPMPQ